ncbi:MAG: hypothetical protein QOE70_3065 [Chthoniobacter sp.]|jgi:hypothetical protein|nr:hypothetical protein [Chthoniobacter sp.]
MNPTLIPGIEPLESRIAPATIFAGNPNADDTEYADTPFLSSTDPNDQIAKVIGPDPDVYFIRLLPGDILEKYDNGYTPFITGPNGTPLKGNVVAFFVDKAHGAAPKNGEMDPDELTGLALGKDVSVQISGTVDGDVVSNYNDVTKTLGGAAEAGGASAKDLLLNSITLFQATSVTGKIISGGEIKGIQLTNNVDQILTGLAANGVTYDFNTAAKAKGGDTLVVTALPGAKGINISNVAAGGVTRIEAGAGGAGGIGGAISGVTLISDTDGLTIKAGNGGDGTAAKTPGGPGGKLSGIVVNGLDENVVDPSPNSAVHITLQSGAGGKGFGAGKGGLGGELSGVSVGYEIKNGKLAPSVNPLQDAVLVQAGDGGDGASGGLGGKLSGVLVLAAPTGAANNIDIKSGNGGKSLVAGGTAGAGGALLGSVIQNSNVLSQASFINIDAGDGGTTAGGVGKGSNGGAVGGIDLVGFSVKVNSGAGSSGSTAAGFGGDVTDIGIADGFVSVFPQTVILDAGGGGSASAGKGNKGGMIAGVTVLNADLKQFDINQTVGSANGGNSSKGVGGAGGLVRDLSINDLDGANEVTMKVRGGDGGTGGGGGAGGALLGSNVIFGFDASLVVQGGAGGAATVKGNGGAGGGVDGLAFVTFGTVGAPAVDASAMVMTGVGGAGKDAGAGGAGGTASVVDLRTAGAIGVTAAKGGVGGATGGAGPGGAIEDMFGRSLLGSISLVAGDAGLTGVKAGAGGAVSVADLRAATSISVTAGAGTAGGVGGDVEDVGFSDTTGTGAPGMAVTLTAGAGSGGGKAAGVGGSVTGATGYIGATGISKFVAGPGGGVATKAAAGGSISDMSIKGGGGAGAELQIDAGDAADVAGVKVGAVGGSVTDVAIDTLALGTIFRRIAAGAGGDTALAGGTGGLGGTVNNVQVNFDIGMRSGQGFGYNTMGGIFAGAGGTGPFKNGLAGNVTNISADAIASIVAGKPVTGDAITVRNLIPLVDGIYLNGNVATIVDNNGTFKNFDTANLIGGVVSPLAAGAAYPAPHPHANTFDLANGEFGDHVGGVVGEFDLGDTITAMTDGFVAAVIFNTANTNVSPEAIFKTDPVDGLVKFFDLNNLNGQTIVP